MNESVAVFERERERLLALAYGFLGSRSEAEDVVQEAWLRYQQNADDTLRPEGWLTTVVSRLALDRLRSAQRRRETYPGVWLPEPVSQLPDPESAESVRSLLSVGLLHLLEKLSPEERAVLVLREAFDRSYEEIAAIVNKSDAACRQMLSRAKRKLKEERAEELTPVPAHVVQQFIEALANEDEEQLVALMTDDAVLYTDGGGRVRSALNPIFGASRIWRFFSGIARKFPNQFSGRMTTANGQPAVFVNGPDGGSVLAFTYNGRRVTGLYLVGNPEKLSDFLMRNTS